MLKQIVFGIVLLAALQVGTACADEALNNDLLNAARGDRSVTVKELISNGADVNAKDNDGDTPLHKAAYFGTREVAELLISKGAHVNAKNNDGDTPLHSAAEGGNKEVAELLIYKGAHVNVKNNDGMTPLALAQREKRDEVVAFFEMKKAALLQAAFKNHAGNQRGTFNLTMETYKDRTMSDDILRPFITLAAKLKPAPAVPEEARKYLVRGNALLQDTKNPGEARAAIQEYQNALLAAPWWGDAYFNLSKAQELAGDLDGAVSSMQYYLLTQPHDKREAQDRLYALEAKRDKAKGK